MTALARISAARCEPLPPPEAAAVLRISASLVIHMSPRSDHPPDTDQWLRCLWRTGCLLAQFLEIMRVCRLALAATGAAAAALDATASLRLLSETDGAPPHLRTTQRR